MTIRLYIPVCHKCHSHLISVYHDKCAKRGHSQLEIDPTTEIVYCPDCGRKWYISDNNYRTECGHEISASYFLYNSDEIIQYSKQIENNKIENNELLRLSEYVKEQNQTKKEIEDFSIKSKDVFFKHFCEYVKAVLIEIGAALTASKILSIARWVLAAFGIYV